jgi:DNA-binding MarR family transcriptional regulator
MNQSEAEDFHQDLLGRLVGVASQELRRRFDLNLQEAGYGLSAAQAILLISIDIHEGVSQQIISDCLSWDKTAMTRAIDALEDKNLVIRAQDKNDRRQNMIYLTPQARDKVKQVMEIALLTENQALAGVDPKRIEICKDVLRLAFENLLRLSEQKAHRNFRRV